MVDRTCLSVKSGLAAKKLAVSPFCLENIYVARFGLVETKSVCFNARLGLGQMDNLIKRITSELLISAFVGRNV